MKLPEMCFVNSGTIMRKTFNFRSFLVPFKINKLELKVLTIDRSKGG